MAPNRTHSDARARGHTAPRRAAASRADLRRHPATAAAVPPRRRRILQPESAGWREAYDAGAFHSQLQLDKWRPKNNEAPDMDGRGVAQFFLVDGPVSPEGGGAVTEAVGGELEQPLVVFLYAGWDAESRQWAPEFKEAAYTVKEAAETAPGYSADFQALDCDEPEAASLCAEPYLAGGDLPGIAVFHAGGASSGERPLSIANIGALRDEAGPVQWAVAARLTGWLKAEIERYKPDAGMVEVEVEVEGGDEPPPEGGEGEGAGAEAGAGDDGGGGAAGAGGEGQEAGAAGAAASYSSANGEFGAPQPSYSFTPSGEPDPAYEPVPDEDEDADYHQRRAAWEAAGEGEGGDGGGGG